MTVDLLRKEFKLKCLLLKIKMVCIYSEMLEHERINKNKTQPVTSKQNIGGFNNYYNSFQ